MSNKQVSLTEKPTIVEQFADNGAHSHWELIDTVTGDVLWSEVDELREQRLNDGLDGQAQLDEDGNLISTLKAENERLKQLVADIEETATTSVDEHGLLEGIRGLINDSRK